MYVVESWLNSPEHVELDMQFIDTQLKTSNSVPNFSSELKCGTEMDVFNFVSIIKEGTVFFNRGDGWEDIYLRGEKFGRGWWTISFPFEN